MGCKQSNTKNEPRRKREISRIAYRLAMERQGRSLDGIQSNVLVKNKNGGGFLPVIPVREFVRRIIGEGESEYNGHTVDTICERLGINGRDWRRWEEGEATQIRVVTVDTILGNANALWWDVFDADRFPEAHRKAALAFEG